MIQKWENNAESAIKVWDKLQEKNRSYTILQNKDQFSYDQICLFFIIFNI